MKSKPLYCRMKKNSDINILKEIIYEATCSISFIDWLGSDDTINALRSFPVAFGVYYDHIKIFGYKSILEKMINFIQDLVTPFLELKISEHGLWYIRIKSLVPRNVLEIYIRASIIALNSMEELRNPNIEDVRKCVSIIKNPDYTKGIIKFFTKGILSSDVPILILDIPTESNTVTMPMAIPYDALVAHGVSGVLDEYIARNNMPISKVNMIVSDGVYSDVVLIHNKTTSLMDILSAHYDMCALLGA